MTLLDLKEGHSATIARLRGDSAFVNRMNGFGIFAGMRIRLIKTAPFRGPLMIEEVSSGYRLMTARSVARGIEVTDVDQAT